MVVVWGAGAIREVLGRSADVYASDAGAKAKGMSHFQPQALTLSRGEEWRDRRNFAESVLAARERLHPSALRFVDVVADEIGRLPGELALDWSAWEGLFDHVTLRVIFGDAAREEQRLTDTQQHAEDRALEAAHADRREGQTALVVVQTSNEQLDGLNARAQALRAQDGLLAGEHAVSLVGRPYGLYAGDEIVLRAASVHPELGAVRNVTRGTVLDVAEDEQHATVQLTDTRQAGFDRGQLDAASARLGYVSHTFPAQGQTVDRCHVIAGEHADSNGTYVALTRARERTHLYASAERLDSIEQDRRWAGGPAGPAG